MKRPLQGFTVQELIVVVGAVALLATILGPSLTSMNRAASLSACLSNLRQVGRASHMYANDDRFEQIVPLAAADARYEITASGFYDVWGWKTALPYAYGGRTPTAPAYGLGYEYVLMDVEEGGNGFWTSERRPLNQYISDALVPDDAAYEVYHCPVDGGYLAEFWQAGAPPGAFGNPCFDYLGNSYRRNTLGVLWPSGGSILTRVLTSPLGHRASSITSPPSETVLYCEPNFHELARAALGSFTSYGWHSNLNSDNVLFLDGSARLTRVDPGYAFSDAELDEMGFSSSFSADSFLRRGPHYQMDCYPTPGAVIRTFSFGGAAMLNPLEYSNYSGWPIDDYQYNVNPE